MSNFYGYITISNGVRSYATVGSGGLEGLLIGNESGLTVVITLQGANTSRSLYPGMIDWFPIPNTNFNGVVQIDPTAMLSNATSWPGSYIQIDTYGIGETPKGTYPVTVNRALNIGNSVSTQMAAASSIVNDGNTAGTQIIEATVGAEGTSAVTLTNSGAMTLGNVSHAGTLNLNGLITSTLANPNLALSMLGKISVDNGNITSDGSGNITCKSITFTNGTITRIAYGTATFVSPPSNNVITITHGLGATPTIALAVNGPTSSTLQVLQVGSLNSTSFQISASAVFQNGDKFMWLAIA